MIEVFEVRINLVLTIVSLFELVDNSVWRSF